MNFRVIGLDPTPFRRLYGLSESELISEGVRRVIADSFPGYPDRVEMRDATVGERLLLVNFTHQPAKSPYRASHAIFVREGATERYEQVGEVPAVMGTRTLSVRAFDTEGMMTDAALTEGRDASSVFLRLLENPETAYLHVHNAVRGCFSGRVERATDRRATA